MSMNLLLAANERTPPPPEKKKTSKKKSVSRAYESEQKTDYQNIPV